MHAVLEIIMPQVDNVEEAVRQIMLPFSENPEEDSEDSSGRHAFWDFYIIGGRWAGWKMTAMLDQDKLNAFYQEITDRGVTVSGLQCGKQELQPATQIPMVDKLWTEFFPEYAGRACPLFNHANNQYENDCLYGDVLRVKDVSKSLPLDHVIVANYAYNDELIEAISQWQTTVWNGVNYEKTRWDGTLQQALELHANSIKNYAEGYIAKNTIQDDWIMVTVDYHS